MINVNCLNNIAACGLKLFSDDYNTESSFEDAQAVLVRSAKMHDMELSDNLLAIARAGAGVNNIPLDKCAEEGIVVFNTPGANANAVKEQVIAAMLLASRDLIGGNKWVADNAEDPDIAKATEKAKKAFAGQEIKGKKLGVIGLGAIGQLVANAAVALGMEVYGYDPYVSVKAAWNLSSEVKYISDVKDIYKECNYITVHVPALDSTKGMINKEAFDLMQDGTVIINCARDVLVDGAAIGEALSLEELRLMFQISLTQQQLRWKVQLFFLILELQQQKLKTTVQLWQLRNLETLSRMVISLIQLTILTVIAEYAQLKEELQYATRMYQQLSAR